MAKKEVELRDALAAAVVEMQEAQAEVDEAAEVFEKADVEVLSKEQKDTREEKKKMDNKEKNGVMQTQQKCGTLEATAALAEATPVPCGFVSSYTNNII